MPKIIIEISEYPITQYLINRLFMDLAEQYKSGAVKGRFALTDTLKVNWKFER